MSKVAWDKLSPADAAILETFVVPRYLSLFGELAQQMLLVGESARIIHLGCRTGYPDLKIYEHAEGADIVGVDTSLPALELARNKAQVMGDVRVEYRAAGDGSLELEEGLYTHAMTLHPAVGSDDIARRQDASLPRLRRLSSRVEQDREIELHFRQELPYARLGLVEVDREHGERPAGELVREPLDRGHLVPARRAPGRPEVDQDHPALVVGEPVVFPLHVLQIEGRRRTALP